MSNGSISVNNGNTYFGAIRQRLVIGHDLNPSQLLTVDEKSQLWTSPFFQWSDPINNYRS